MSSGGMHAANQSRPWGEDGGGAQFQALQSGALKQREFAPRKLSGETQDAVEDLIQWLDDNGSSWELPSTLYRGIGGQTLGADTRGDQWGNWFSENSTVAEKYTKNCPHKVLKYEFHASCRLLVCDKDLYDPLTLFLDGYEIVDPRGLTGPTTGILSNNGTQPHPWNAMSVGTCCGLNGGSGTSSSEEALAELVHAAGYDGFWRRSLFASTGVLEEEVYIASPQTFLDTPSRSYHNSCQRPDCQQN